MSAEWYLGLRRRVPSPGRLLASWQLSVVLMVLAAVYYALLAVWARVSPAPIIASIAGLAPFWVVYLLILVNSCFCLWRRLGALRRELQGRRWAALGPFIFHGAFLVIALGFLLTVGYRRESKAWVAVGEEFTGEPAQILARPASGAELPGFRLEALRPELWRDQLLFTSLEATVEGAAGRRFVTRINRPLWIGWDRFLRLSGFGYAPRFELQNAHGGLLESSFVKMNVFPPGQRDWFRPGIYPFRVYLQVYPDADLEGGSPRSRSLNLRQPILRVQVLRGKLDLGRADLRLGQAFDLEGMKLRFAEIGYWGEFTLVDDPGAPLIFIGFALGLLGLLLGLSGRVRR